MRSCRWLAGCGCQTWRQTTTAVEPWATVRAGGKRNFWVEGRPRVLYMMCPCIFIHDAAPHSLNLRLGSSAFCHLAVWHFGRLTNRCCYHVPQQSLRVSSGQAPAHLSHPSTHSDPNLFDSHPSIHHTLICPIWARAALGASSGPLSCLDIGY